MQQLLVEAPDEPRSRVALGLLIGGLVLALAGFLALGAWQLQRMGWKHDLIERVGRNANATPVAAPSADRWPGLTVQADEYRRIRVRGHFQHAQATLVQASTELGTGYWVLTPLRTEEGFWVLVNRGFVPSNRELETGDANDQGASGSVNEVVGLLRFSEPEGRLLRRNEVATQRWYSRDVTAIAAARGLPADGTAPYFLDAVAGPAQGTGTEASWPRAGLTVLHFSDNHLVYACTWLALAAMVACAIAYIVADDRRQRRLAGEHLAAHPGD